MLKDNFDSINIIIKAFNKIEEALDDLADNTGFEMQMYIEAALEKFNALKEIIRKAAKVLERGGGL